MFTQIRFLRRLFRVRTLHVGLPSPYLHVTFLLFQDKPGCSAACEFASQIGNKISIPLLAQSVNLCYLKYIVKRSMPYNIPR